MKTKIGLILFAGMLVLLGLPVVASAQCTDSVIVLADGQPRQVTIPFNGSGTYVRGVFFRAAPGRSYSVEVFGGSFATLNEIFVGAANSLDCPLTNAAGVRDIRDVEPRGFTGSAAVVQRYSFTVTAPIDDEFSPTFTTRMRNFSTTTDQTVTVTVTDTTLFNPLWSTFGGFETFYRFQNTTNAACSVTLRMVNDGGTEVVNTAIPLMPNSTASTRNTGPTDLNLANDQAGQAIITHNCPPGAIQVDGFLGLFGAQTNVLPIKIEAARQMR